MDGHGAGVNRLRATTQKLREKCVQELGDERRWNHIKRLLKAERAEKGTRCAQHSQEQGRGHPTPSQQPAPQRPSLRRTPAHSLWTRARSPGRSPHDHKAGTPTTFAPHLHPSPDRRSQRCLFPLGAQVQVRTLGS